MGNAATAATADQSALPMIAEANPQTGLLMESLEAKLRIRALLDRKTAKVKPA
jgi:hypothetical protein